MAPFAPYTYSEDFQPDEYHRPGVVKFVRGLPRYGFTKEINVLLEGTEEKNSYVKGVVISSCCLLVLLVVWSLILLFLKLYSSGWPAGEIKRPVEPEGFKAGETVCAEDSDEEGSAYGSGSNKKAQPAEIHDDTDSGDDDERSRSSYQASVCSASTDGSGLSIPLSIFSERTEEEELTMAVIAREQKYDATLRRAKRKHPENFSTTTNGRITLITTREDDDDEGLFRVLIPDSLRLRLLRTYHDCLVHPTEDNNAELMIYEYFTWKGMRRDADRYVRRYRRSIDRGTAYDEESTYDDDYDDDEDDDDNSSPITLDVIAYEQKVDRDLAKMMQRAPSVFSTATNGSIQLITARGKDKKYRIVIPKSLQAKVLKTYHDCLVNPTEENNFEKVLYVHFTWNGIHKDVENYVRHDGLTDEMRERNGGSVCSRSTRGRDRSRRSSGGYGSDRSRSGSGSRSRAADSGVPVHHGDESYMGEDQSESSSKPIGLDEIAKEQKKDKELRQLKKEEPFVFSTVRYGNTLLTTAQNFRDNKYRIVIPRSLQGRMLLTYRECLLNPTPDRNFDTLLYNHFTWNGIHDDVDFFVKSHGKLPKKDDQENDNNASSSVMPLGKKNKKEKKAKKDSSPKKASSKEVERSDDPEYAEWEAANERFERRMKRIRIAFLISGLLVIISSIMFFQLGVNTVFRSLDDAQGSLYHTENVANSALSVTGEYLEAQAGIQETARRIGTYPPSDWCPVGGGSNFTKHVRNATYDVGIRLRDVATRIEAEVNDIEGDLEGLLDKVNEANSSLDNFKAYVMIAKVFVIFIDIIVSALMLACILSWVGKQNCIARLVRNAFVIPVFILLITLFWICSTATLLGAMAGSDFCSFPDEASVSIILKYQDNFSSLVFVLLMYYITGCQPVRLPPKLETLSVALAAIGSVVHDQLNDVITALQESKLGDQCGGEEGPSRLVEVLEVTDSSMHAIYDVLFGVRSTLECKNFNPIYTTLVYDAVCNSGVGGLSWMFFTSLSMAIFSMVMVTLRVAVY